MFIDENVLKSGHCEPLFPSVGDHPAYYLLEAKNEQGQSYLRAWFSYAADNDYILHRADTPNGQWEEIDFAEDGAFDDIRDVSQLVDLLNKRTPAHERITRDLAKAILSHPRAT